jgi:succinyl-CoA synthetase beta subunit
VLLSQVQTTALLTEYGLLTMPSAGIVACKLLLRLELDRQAKCPILVVSLWRDSAIQEPVTVSEKIDPIFGLHTYQISNVAGDLNLPPEYWQAFIRFTRLAFNLYDEAHTTSLILHVSLLERSFFAIDGCYITVEEEGEFAHNSTEQDWQYVALEGSIACMGNGAGLVMSAMDTFALMSDTPNTQAYCFLEIDDDKLLFVLSRACEFLVEQGQCRVILLNCFCTIVGCDEVAERILQIYRRVSLDMPLVLRLDGLHVAEGLAILNRVDDLPIYVRPNLRDAVEQAIALAKDMAHDTAIG